MKIKIRRSWTRNPKTKIVESDKIYSRKKEKNKIKREVKDAQSN